MVAFGGDGTVNEAANGLAGSETPLTSLPRLGQRLVPDDRDPQRRGRRHRASPAHGRRLPPAQVDLGRVNGRCFVFASGVGLDASVVERVDAHPYRKARFGAWYYSVAAVGIFNRRYLVNPPVVRVRTGERADGRDRDRRTRTPSPSSARGRSG